MITPKTSKNRGFTMVELLTTIMIIAVLMALLMPAFSRIRGMADSTKCVSNLKQIGAGITLYAADHDDHLPGPLGAGQFAYYFGEDSVNGGGGRLASYLQGYIAPPRESGGNYRSDVFICPAFTRVIPAHPQMLCYVINKTAITPKDQDGTKYFPFGQQETSTTAAIPTQRIGTLQGFQRQLSTIWVLADYDGESPGMSKSSKNPKQFPDHPVHPVYRGADHASSAEEAHKGGYRNALFFDFHVGRVNIADNSAQ